jgi:predicted phosphodiesterase
VRFGDDKARIFVRTAIISDIHGNLTALEAVLADLQVTTPDLILHGGDLADNGSSPVEVVDMVQSAGWQGVAGNTDEMLSTPAAFEEFAAQLPALETIWAPAREMAAFTRDLLGADRLAWLRGLPKTQVHGAVALVHASPDSRWRSPFMQATDAELEQAYQSVPQPTVVYGHIHTPFIRHLNDTAQSGRWIANSGSVGQSHDGDRRAAYLLLDDSVPTIRRVEYDVDRELKALSACGLPHADWVKRIIQTASPQMP